MSTQLNITRRERKEKVFLWLRQNGLTYTSLARKMGMSQWGVSKLLERPTIPTRRHRQLVELGLPTDLLPPAKDIPTGPKPRTESD